MIARKYLKVLLRLKCHRQKIYKSSYTNQKDKIAIEELDSFITLANEFVEHTIKANKREDNLYHSYNLISVEDDRFSISYLPEMLRVNLLY